jgi:hypothetical protein
MYADDTGLRPGLSRFLSEFEGEQEKRPSIGEGPGNWAPVAVSRGPRHEHHRAALETFHAWLEDRREPLAS